MSSAQIRIQTVFSALATTANAFARTHQINVTTLYGFVNGSRSPGYDLLTAICAAEPRISAEYLLRGEGEPLRDVQRAAALSSVEELQAFQEQMNATIEKRIRELSEVSGN